MELITSVTVGSGGAASVTLPATGTIPATYTDLKVVVSSRSARGGGQVSDGVAIEFNGSSSNLSMVYLDGNGSTAGSSTGTSIWTRTSASGATASTFGNAEFYISNYTSSNFKSVSVDGVSENNATSAFAMLSAGLWSNTAAITSIRLVSINAENFVEGSTFYLYGISNVTSGSKATGGIVSSDGTYWYHMFPYSSTFTPTTNLTADYLVIAGGAGGGTGNSLDYGGGGGGAGGLRSTITVTGGGGSLESALSLTANTGYTVTVGAGGNGAQSDGANGSAGSNSVFSTITSTGGGYGAAAGNPGSNGGNGGSGGGASSRSSGNTTGGTGTSGQGYAGGNYTGFGGGSQAGNGGAGGGGAGAVGGAAVYNVGGAGGNGVQIATVANATQTGTDNGYYAGGGGGSGSGLAGGLGGGGRGANPVASGGAAIANTGGGGGGSSGNSSSKGGNGGSGLVVIRYAI